MGRQPRSPGKLNANPYRPRPVPQTSSHSAALGLTRDQGPGTVTSGNDELAAARALPDKAWGLPWPERRYYEKIRAGQKKAIITWDKAERQRGKAEEAAQRDREKADQKRWKKEVK